MRWGRRAKCLKRSIIKPGKTSLLTNNCCCYKILSQNEIKKHKMMKYNSVVIVFFMSIKTAIKACDIALGQHTHVLSSAVIHGCVSPKGELSEPHLVDTDYAVDLIQLCKRKGGEGRRAILCFAVHMSQNNRKGKVCWQPGLLRCAKSDKQSLSRN